MNDQTLASRWHSPMLFPVAAARIGRLRAWLLRGAYRGQLGPANEAERRTFLPHR